MTNESLVAEESRPRKFILASALALVLLATLAPSALAQSAYVTIASWGPGGILSGRLKPKP